VALETDNRKHTRKIKNEKPRVKSGTNNAKEKKEA
jgi:hypothetical protein